MEELSMRGMSYKWIVAIVIIFGIFMSVLDTTIVNIAIPRLQTAFGASLDSVQWVATAYTLAQGVATPLTPFLSTRLGLKRFYILALALFTLCSALCGLAWSLPVLIIFRILQGAGGAFLLPMSITLLYREFPPEERGTALGALGVPILLAPALGPTVGGYIVTYAGWQLIFYINVPIGILGVILGFILLREFRPEGESYFDLPGFIFSAVGMSCVLYAFSDASTDGWGSSKVLSFLIGGIVSLVIFVVVELLTASNGRQPLLDLRVFRNQPFATASIAYVMVTFALFGGLFLVPVYLQDLRGLSAYQAGLILLPQALGSMVAVVFGGRLVDKLGVKPVVVPGLILLGAALWGLSSVSLKTPYANFQVWLVLRGMGLGLCVQNITVAALMEIKPAQLAQANSINSVIRAVASSLGVAVLSTLVQTRTQFHYVRLADQVTADSSPGKLLLQELAAMMAKGASRQVAWSTMVQEYAGQLQQQAYMLAINDAFLFTLGIALIAVFVVVFVLRVHRAEKSVAISQGSEIEEEMHVPVMEV
jgi:DHA2 family multidrug resistance protein